MTYTESTTHGDQSGVAGGALGQWSQSSRRGEYGTWGLSFDYGILQAVRQAALGDCRGHDEHCGVIGENRRIVAVTDSFPSPGCSRAGDVTEPAWFESVPGGTADTLAAVVKLISEKLNAEYLGLQL